MTKYFIKWESLITGCVGQGKPVFDTYESAAKECESLNRKYSGEIKHWVEFDPV